MNSVGIILTILFTPEPLRVPLAELDRRYDYYTAGKVYHGAHHHSTPRQASTPGALSFVLRAGHVIFKA